MICLSDSKLFFTFVIFTFNPSKSTLNDSEQAHTKVSTLY